MNKKEMFKRQLHTCCQHNMDVITLCNDDKDVNVGDDKDNDGDADDIEGDENDHKFTNNSSKSFHNT